MKRVLFAFSVMVLGQGSSFAQGVSFDSSVPEDVVMQFSVDMKDLNEVRGSGSVSPLHREIFGPVSGESYLKFINDRIHRARLAKEGEFPPYALAAVRSFEDPNQLILTPGYVDSDNPQVLRWTTIIHEARHSEKVNDYWNHEYCPESMNDRDGNPIVTEISGVSLAGKPGCDTTARGAYGVEIIFLKNIEKNCDTCNGIIKKQAKFYGDALMSRILAPKSQAALLKELYDGKDEGLRPYRAP